MSGVQFEMNINLGHMLTIGFGIVAFVLAWGKFSARLDMLELRVGTMEKALEKIATALLQIGQNDKALGIMQSEQATMQNTLNLLQQQIEGLRRGEGFIAGPRRGVDGEYSRSA
jgi:hypothetical protein